MSESFFDFKHLPPLLSQIQTPSKVYQKDVSSSKSHLTYQTHDSFCILSLLGSKKSGKTFILEKLFDLTNQNLEYSPTSEINIKLGTKQILKEVLPLAVLDGPGTPKHQVSETIFEEKDIDDEILSHHFIENFMMYASNIVVLVVEHSMEKKKRENKKKIEWITNLVKKNKKIFVVHNLKKVANHQELNSSLDEIINDYGLSNETEYQQRNAYKFNPARFEYFLSISNQNSNHLSHFFFIWEKDDMSEIEAKNYNLYMANALLKACKEIPPKKLDYCRLFNEFFLKNYSLYFETEQDLLPEAELFSLNFDKQHGFLVFNEAFSDHCKKLQKPLFDSHGNLYQRKLEYSTTIIDENETRYQILLPGLKNPTVILLKLKQQQYIRIIGNKLSENDLKFNANKKKTMFALLKDSLEDLKTPEKRVEKLFRVSKKFNEFSLIGSSIAYLNGILTFILTRKLQKTISSDPEQQKIFNILSDIPVLDEQDITIFDEIESFAQRKTFHAYYVVKRVNVILSTFPTNNVEIILELKKESECLRDLQTKVPDFSQQIVKDFGIFKLFDRKTNSFKLARLFEAYSLTLRRRMDIKPYSDKELGYILLDLCRGLLELEENSDDLVLGNLNPQTIGVFPSEKNKNQENFSYKYKFFDFRQKESFSSTKKHPFNRLIHSVRLHRENSPNSSENPGFLEKLDCLTQLEALTKNPLLSHSEVLDFLESYSDLFEKPFEEFVVFRDRDRVLVEMDLLKSIFLPDPYEKQQTSELRKTLVPKNKQNANLLRQSAANLRESLIEEAQFGKNFAKSLKSSNQLNMIELETLGIGGFCRVCKAFDFDSQKYVAMKFFSPDKGLDFSQEELEVIAQEYEVLSFIEKLGKPEYFLRFYDGIWDKVKKSVIFKLENGVCNMREILNNRKSYREREILYILSQMLETLAFLEENGFAHRDIKPENFILLNEKAYYKISDFGNALKLEGNKQKKTVSLSTLQAYSELYAAPEIIAYQELDYESNEEYEPFLADVYSLGLVILAMMGLKNTEIHKIKDLEPERLRSELEAFKWQEYPFLCDKIELFLQKSPEKRLRFKEILQKIADQPKEKPNDRELVDIIEKNRREKPDPFEKVKHSVRFARLYYELGNIKEAEKYAFSAFQNVELTESCYEMEILRIKGLLARSSLNYEKAEKFYKRYDQILVGYKELVGIIEDNDEEPLDFESKWRKGFKSLNQSEKTKVLKKFWTIQMS